MPVGAGIGANARLWCRGPQPRKRIHSGSPPGGSPIVSGVSRIESRSRKPSTLGVEAQRRPRRRWPSSTTCPRPPSPVTNRLPYGLTAGRLSSAAPQNSSSVLPNGSSNRISSGDPALGEFVRAGLLGRHAGLLERAAEPRQRTPRRPTSQPDGEQPVALAGHDHQPGREVVHPQVQRVRDRARDPRTMPSTLTPKVAPRLEVGGLDAQVPQRPDRRLTVRPLQEVDRQPVELVELLQLRPVPAAAEDVQPGAPDAA